MEIKIIPIISKSGGSRSKYLPYFAERFTEDVIENIKRSLEQIKNNPNLGIVIDITDIKQISERKNKINERGLITEDGQTKVYGTIVNALIQYFLIHDIKGVYILIREQDDKVQLIIKDASTYKQKQTVSSTSN